MWGVFLFDWCPRRESNAHHLCSHQESNLDRKLRRLAFYPLNYGSKYGEGVDLYFQLRPEINSGCSILFPLTSFSDKIGRGRYSIH